MKLVKKMMVAGLTGALMLGNCVTAFASESGAYLYGQELVNIDNQSQQYFAIVVGDSDGVIDRNELTFDKGASSHELFGASLFGGEEFGRRGDSYGKRIPELKKKNGVWATPKSLQNEISGYDDENAIGFIINKELGGLNNVLGIVKLPDNVKVSELSSDLKKYVIYAKDMSTNPESWRSDAIGWWYDNGDGTYPTNRWLDIAGRSYYFGSDGYMLHDTTTPDGSSVGSDGALLH
jgi:hypothetical protein